MTDDFDRDFFGVKHEFPNEGTLFEFLRDQMLSAQRKTAIMAGCYMLGYDKSAGELLPLIPEDYAAGERLHSEAVRLGGEFPLKTFRNGLDLLQLAPEQSRIVVLVNDHFAGTQERSSEAGKRMGELRQKYFWADSPLPKSYDAELAARNCRAEDVLFELKRPDAGRQDIMPQSSRLISEKYLLNKFDDGTRYRLDDYPGFVRKPVVWGPAPIVFCPTGDEVDPNPICLSSNDCGCTVIIIELALALLHHGFERLIILTPDECHTPVNASAQAAVHREGLRLPQQIIVVSGLGRMLGVNHGSRGRGAFAWQYDPHGVTA